MHSITCLSLLFSISVVIFLPSASFASPPEQGHLALLPAASSGVSVTWVQQNSSNGYVKYGTSASNLNNIDSSNVDVCFECCAYGKCPDGWTCCGCPNVCICCDDNYECTSGDPYSCVSPSAGELSFVAYLRKNHLIKSKKALENVKHNIAFH